MKERSIPVTQFLDASDIEAIHRAAGVAGTEEEDDGIEEEIDEDVG
jgi:hypothetical protein